MNFLRISLLAPLVCTVYLQSCTPTTPPGAQAAKHTISHVVPQTPDEALNLLKQGNKRFLADSLENNAYKDQVAATKDAQHPYAFVLCCMDSRVPPEIIFDQGIGNIFVSRIAGNIEDADILGSMEYAAVAKGVKLIIVMGHTHCGAVTGAVSGEGGSLPDNLTQLLAKIKPAKTGDTVNKEKLIDESARTNVKMTITNIAKDSKAISELISQNKLAIVGAYYDIGTGKVEFIQ